MTSMRELVAGILKCPVQSIHSRSGLGVDPRWDSFAQLNIMLALEEQYNIEITDENIRRYSRFDALQELAQSRETAR